MYCLKPPLTEAPEGSWSCHLCIVEFHQQNKNGSSTISSNSEQVWSLFVGHLNYYSIQCSIFFVNVLPRPHCICSTTHAQVYSCLQIIHDVVVVNCWQPIKLCQTFVVPSAISLRNYSFFVVFL
jgi:hypothetical protein